MYIFCQTIVLYSHLFYIINSGLNLIIELVVFVDILLLMDSVYTTLHALTLKFNYGHYMMM